MWAILIAIAQVSGRSAACQDTRDTASCARWRDIYNGCTLYESYMAAMCARTCGMCPETPAPTAALVPPPTSSSPGGQNSPNLAAPAPSSSSVIVRVDCSITMADPRLCEHFSCAEIRIQELCPRMCSTCITNEPSVSPTQRPTVAPAALTIITTNSPTEPIEAAAVENGAVDKSSTTGDLHSSPAGVGVIVAGVIVLVAALLLVAITIRRVQHEAVGHASSNKLNQAIVTGDSEMYTMDVQTSPQPSVLSPGDTSESGTNAQIHLPGGAVPNYSGRCSMQSHMDWESTAPETLFETQSDVDNASKVSADFLALCRSMLGNQRATSGTKSASPMQSVSTMLYSDPESTMLASANDAYRAVDPLVDDSKCSIKTATLKIAGGKVLGMQIEGQKQSGLLAEGVNDRSNSAFRQKHVSDPIYDSCTSPSEADIDRCSQPDPGLTTPHH